MWTKWAATLTAAFALAACDGIVGDSGTDEEPTGQDAGYAGHDAGIQDGRDGGSTTGIGAPPTPRPVCWHEEVEPYEGSPGSPATPCEGDDWAWPRMRWYCWSGEDPQYMSGLEGYTPALFWGLPYMAQLWDALWDEGVVPGRPDWDRVLNPDRYHVIYTNWWCPDHDYSDLERCTPMDVYDRQQGEQFTWTVSYDSDKVTYIIRCPEDVHRLETEWDGWVSAHMIFGPYPIANLWAALYTVLWAETDWPDGD